jgi:hypothetical protein
VSQTLAIDIMLEVARQSESGPGHVTTDLTAEKSIGPARTNQLGSRFGFRRVSESSIILRGDTAGDAQPK